MREFDVAIVGAGIAGASLAYHLAGRRSVLLLEREAQPGYHSTGRSAAMFMESYGPPCVRALTRASRAFYEQPPRGFAAARILSPRGVMYVATHEQQALLQSLHGELAGGGTRIETLTADEALARVPCLNPEVLYGALFEPDAQDIDVNALHQGFLRGARARGAELRVNAGLAAAAREGKVWQLRLADGAAFCARTVVDAAGAWADEVAAFCGVVPVGLEPRRRSAFTFKAPEGVDSSRWPAVVGVDESFYFKPDAGQLLGSPANADPTLPHDVAPEEFDIAVGIHQIEAVTTLSIRRPASTWAGLRSFVHDGEMVIGWDERRDGFFWLAAQGGYGIQSAAGASELAAALICGEPLPAELARHGVEPHAVAPERLR
ncbi:MAG: FAD-dependent oxidoreductase [Burkholderiales bacterium]